MISLPISLFYLIYMEENNNWLFDLFKFFIHCLLYCYIVVEKVNLK